MISRTLDRIEFVGLPPFSRIIEGIAMETMHFHIAHTKIYYEDNFVSHSGGRNEQFGTHENCTGKGRI